MTIPTQQDKNEMERLRRLMDRGQGDASGSSAVPQQADEPAGNLMASTMEDFYASSGAAVPQVADAEIDYGNDPMPALQGVTVTEKDVSAMHDILSRFHNVTEGAAERLVENSQHSSRLREALRTERTSDGVRVGHWEIRVRLEEGASGKSIKYYTVVDSSDGRILAKDMILFEAAELLVRYYNDGMHIPHPNVMRVLNLEQLYCKHRDDALRYRRLVRKHHQQGDRKAAQVFEARYDQARADAQQARETLRAIYQGR